MKGYENALKLLPPRLACSIERSGVARGLREIRLRKEGPLSLTVGAENVCIDTSGRRCHPRCAVRCTEEELHLVLERATDASLYRHMPSLQKGYVTTPTGIRVGICGRGIYGAVEGALRVELTSLNLRIPVLATDCAEGALRYYRENFLASTLFYASPGGGKTTLIRALALSLSSGELGQAYRVAVVDEREEIFPCQVACSGLLDVLRGYTKAEAMECAVRVLNPQILICDEVGSGECEGIRALASSGIVLMATAHASCVRELRMRGELGQLIGEGYFPLVAGIRLGATGVSLSFERVGERV